MNSLGVALASDSAATVNNGEGGKVFNTADKLFMLSKRHPVGVMVYENAAILGVPYGTVGSRMHHAMRLLRATLEAGERPTHVEGQIA